MALFDLSDRRPSVLHVFKVYYPDLFGGTLTVIRSICDGLKSAFASAVLVCSRSAAASTEQVDGARVERVRSFGDLYSLPMAPAYPFRLWRRIREHDLIALHAPFPLADLVFALGLGRSRPLVVHWHADIVSHARLRWLVEPFIRRTLARAEAIIVSDPVLAQTTPLLQPFLAKCRAVPFGIDLDRYREAPHRQVRADGRQVVACGRLVPYKGFDVLIRAAAMCECEVAIVGEGRERARLEALIAELGLGDRVRLEGSLADDELTALMSKADLFVMPSVTSAETFGLVQLEAMAAGLPIVNTALETAVPRVARDGIEAVTLPPGDVAGLAGAIGALLADPDRRGRMGRAARDRAETTYSIAAFRDGTGNVYRAAIASHAAAAAGRARAGLRGAVQVAAALAWADMRHRYVRSVLGPFWMSLQMAIMVVVLGSVVGQLGHTKMTSRLPMLALSLTAWTFLSGVVTDATTALQMQASLIKDRALPPLVCLLQCCFRQGLFALHNACVPLLLWLALAPFDLESAAAALPGFALFVAAAIALSIVLGALATRFRDLKPIIESGLTLGFLASPILWSPELIDRSATLIKLNPLTHLFAVWREPLTTGHVPGMSMVYVIACVLVLGIGSIIASGHLRKAAFWI